MRFALWGAFEESYSHRRSARATQSASTRARLTSPPSPRNLGSSLARPRPTPPRRTPWKVGSKTWKPSSNSLFRSRPHTQSIPGPRSHPKGRPLRGSGHQGLRTATWARPVPPPASQGHRSQPGAVLRGGPCWRLAPPERAPATHSGRAHRTETPRDVIMPSDLTSPPPPGSPEAIQQGCLCPPADNAEVAEVGMLTLTSRCPLHRAIWDRLHSAQPTSIEAR